jgi:hypothetical protein
VTSAAGQLGGPTLDQRAAPVVAATAGGLALLLLRPWLPRHDAVLVGLFVLLGCVALAWPIPRATSRGVPGVALLIGIGAFLLGRLAGLGAGHIAASARVVELGVLAAVAEEAFFRRFLYGALARYGEPVAVGVTAVLPLDLAAGLLLSWQRAVSGTWTVPAATHVVANLLAVL